MSDQIAVVTGAAGGFGRAISQTLLDIGYHVVATDLSLSGLETLRDDLHCPEQLSVFEMDVTDFESVHLCAEKMVKQLGNCITVLVNNAGVIERSYCLSSKGLRSTQKIMDVNLTGAFNCTEIFARYMARMKYGRIINIASIAGIWGAGGGSAYAASKAGLISATESWGCELGQMNISVTAVAPGICHTNMLEKFVDSNGVSSQEEARYVRSIVPVGRFGDPEDVAEVVGFLASCKTNYLNTAVIPLDGGMRVGTM